ncbi:hypothetical protein V2J09_014857 [Rumex salicifolius]
MGFSDSNLLGTEEWKQEVELYWEESHVRHLPVVKSDHNPLLLPFKADISVNRERKPFRFEAAWLLHSDFHPFVRWSWCKEAEDVFGNIHKKKVRLLARIEGLQKTIERRNCQGLIDLDGKLREELDIILKEEETLWFQKSREKWIAYRDRNTKYFNASTVVRRRKNKIDALRIDDEN